MKKKNLIIGVLIFLLILILIYLIKQQNNSTINFNIQGRNYRLLKAKTQNEWEKGLMFVKKLDNADGMIFIFPDKQSRSFWNKNTLADLDLYWLVDDKVVGKSFLPSIEKSKEVVVVNSPKPVDKVVELVVK